MTRETAITEEAAHILRRGVKLSDQDKFDEAIECFHEVIKLHPNYTQGYIQRGRADWEMKRWVKAVDDFDRALELDPENPDIRWTLCLMHLQLADFKRGWRDIEYRWQSKKFDSPRLKTNKPLWHKDLGAEEVFVWSEQGVGDQILYASLLPILRNCVKDLFVMVDARMIPLFKRSFPNMTFMPQNARVRGFDAQIPIGSIGAEFIRKLDDIPEYAARNYLKVDPMQIERMRYKIGKAPGELIVGLSWHSGAPRIGNHKSVRLPELEPLFKLPNTRFVSLQYGACYGDIDDLERETGYVVEDIAIDKRNDFDALAGLIMACDVVVTVSNATAHLAGALGKDTYLLDANKLWYWSNTRQGNNLWYPCVRTFPRDNVVTPWTKQIQEMTDAVRVLPRGE